MKRLREKIEFVHMARTFGEGLGLDFNGSFQTYEPHHPSPYWLYASERYAVKNVFVNPYIYGTEARSLKKLKDLFEKFGYDSYLFTAEAWGGLVCPILPRLLNASPARQTYVVLHEGWHRTSFLSGLRHPYEFEEPMAIVFGSCGSLLFAKEYGGKGFEEEVIRYIAAGNGFYDWVNTSCRRLEDGYSTLGEGDYESFRKNMFRQIREGARQFPEWVSPVRGYDFVRSINNAFFVRYRNYSIHRKLLWRVAERLGDIGAIFETFKNVSKQKENARKYFEKIIK